MVVGQLPGVGGKGEEGEEHQNTTNKAKSSRSGRKKDTALKGELIEVEVKTGFEPPAQQHQQ